MRTVCTALLVHLRHNKEMNRGLTYPLQPLLFSNIIILNQPNFSPVPRCTSIPSEIKHTKSIIFTSPSHSSKAYGTACRILSPLHHSTRQLEVHDFSSILLPTNIIFAHPYFSPPSAPHMSPRLMPISKFFDLRKQDDHSSYK
jgi:hypothetical protein